MRRKNVKVKQFALNGARINSVFISKIARDCFVTGDSMNNIRFYEFDAEEETFCFSSSSNTVNVQNQVSAVSFNAQQKQIYAGSNRGIIHIWDMGQGKQVNLLKGHSTSVNCFGIFPQQPNRMASGSYDTNIKLWDIRDKNNYATLKGHSKQVNSIDISPDRNMLVSGSQDNTCKMWDLRYPQKIITTYNQHASPVIKVMFNPDDMMFASCSMDKTAKYYRCEPPNHFSFVSSTDMVATAITAITFDDEGKFLYTAANDTLKIWNMAKNGLLLETIQSSWKGVQDISWTPNGLLGVAAGTHHLSIWTFDQKQKLAKKMSQKKQSDSTIFPNINKNKKDVQRDLLQAMNNINQVMGVVNNLQKQKKQKLEDRQAQQTEQQKQRNAQEQRKKAEQLQQQILQKQRKRQEQLIKQKEQRQRLQAIKKQQQKKKMYQLQKQRIERQGILQQKIYKTFDKQIPQDLQSTVNQDTLQSSTVMNLSYFMVDGVQKQKLKQIQLIGEMLKGDSTFETVMRQRIGALKPIIHFWTQGQVQSSIRILNQSQASIVSDATAAILKNSKFRFGITPQVAVQLLEILCKLMNNKHGTYVKSSMSSINEIVNLFKDQLVKIKSFSPMTKNDLAREERLAKYNKLIGGFLDVFNQERLKKYALGRTKSENTQLVQIAGQLYKNLEDVLKKLVPKKQPQPA